MRRWTKSRLKLQGFVSLIKDQVSLSCAMANRDQLSHVDLVVLRATSHEEQPTDEETIESVLAVGNSSRMRVSHCVRLIMDRLNRTRSWTVALKCLILVHRCLHEGGFMYQDQLSVCPTSGGRNYLNLSKFKDTSSPFTWAVSAFIRLYARFIEQWIQTSRIIGAFLDIKVVDKSLHAEKLMALATGQLIGEIISLEEFLHEASRLQGEDFVTDHFLVKDGLRLCILTTIRAYEDLKLRFEEVGKRIMALSQTEALELMHVCERLSAESMVFSHLFEIGADLQVQPNFATSGQVVYADHELMKLKEALRLASLHNVSTLPTSNLLVTDGFSQPLMSMRWEKASVVGLTVTKLRRGKSMSDFGFYDTPM